MGQNILLLNTKVDMQKTLAANVTITAISKAAEAVVTATNTYTAGDLVVITAVLGMAEINNRVVRVKSPSGSAFTCEGLDSTAFSTYASAGVANKITAFDAFDNLTSLSYPEPSPNAVDVTTIHLTQKLEIFGLDDAPTITMNTISDPLSVTIAAVRAASLAKALRAFRCTLQNGNILIFNGYVAGGRGLDGSAGAVATGQISVKLAMPEQYFVS